MLDVKGKRRLGYATHGVQQLGSRGCNIKFNNFNYRMPEDVNCVAEISSQFTKN